MTLWTENLIQVSNAHKIQIDSKGRAIFLLKSQPTKISEGRKEEKSNFPR